MGPTWGPSGRQNPGGPYVGPMNLAIWDIAYKTWKSIQGSAVHSLVESVISEHISLIKYMSTSNENALRWMLQNIFDEK